jgi:hypothetical protein
LAIVESRDISPAGSLRVPLNLNSLESLFDIEGLREFGARGLESLVTTAADWLQQQT